MTLRVKEAFSVDQGGFHRVLRPGDLIDESDPVVTPGRRQFFEPVDVAVTREQDRVEQATAAPGEKRSVSTRRRAAKKLESGDSGSSDAS
ncbi:MAG TPA: hypothetical protein VIR15_13720 [Intrasporangium sp.]|jgi:hypothetical protein|uniref:hypothetical protein n=1 Tax=Intrasporangium sp. TaxID=1925024 RepID=UPI002F947698